MNSRKDPLTQHRRTPLQRVENRPVSSRRKSGASLGADGETDAKRQNAGKKNPKQLMEAWDLKMHKPWS